MEPIQSRVKVGDIVETSYTGSTLKGKKVRIVRLDDVRDLAVSDIHPSARNLWIIETLDGFYSQRLSEGWFKIPIKPRKCHFPSWF